MPVTEFHAMSAGSVNSTTSTSPPISAERTCMSIRNRVPTSILGPPEAGPPSGSSVRDSQRVIPAMKCR
jgi:hypothetical protein